MHNIQGTTEWVDSMESLEDKPKRAKRPKVGTRPFTEGTPLKKPDVRLVKQGLAFLKRLKAEETDALKVAIRLIDIKKV